MKRLLLALLFSASTYAQYTPTANLGLQVPATNSLNWQGPLDYDLNTLDAILAGSATLPTGATPSVSQTANFTTANTATTTITNFLAGLPGQSIRIVCGSADTFTTIPSSATISVAATFSCASARTITFVLFGTVWQEVSRTGVTGCLSAGAAGTLQAASGTGSCVASSLNDNGTTIVTAETLQAGAFQTPSAHPALGSTIRLAPADTIGWRNFANTGDNNLATVIGDIGNVPIDTLEYGAGIGTSFLAVQLGSNIAASGGLRFPALGSACWRNGSNSADLCLSKNSSDLFTLAAPFVAPGGSCTMSSSTTCTVTLPFSFVAPICLVTLQGSGGGIIAAECSVSGTTATVTAASANSLRWGVSVFD
jgi:hypothetical protein